MGSFLTLIDMGAMNNKFIEISNWLKSNRNYNDGVFLYNKYGNSQNLKILFPGKEKFHSRKLAYELAKLIGMGFHEFNNDLISGLSTGSNPELDLQEDTGPTGPNPKAENSVLQTINRRMIEYPPLIKRITYEFSTLYKERAMLKNQQNSIPDENTPENIAKRKELIERVEIYSERMEILNQAREDYFNKGTIPDEKALFPNQKEEEKTVEELEIRLKNLRSYQSKDNNLLLFQREKKQDKPNPLPDSPKKEKIVKRMEEREKEIQEIEQKIKDASSEEQHREE